MIFPDLLLKIWNEILYATENMLGICKKKDCLVTCNKYYQMHSYECNLKKKQNIFHLEFSFNFNEPSFLVPWQPEPWKRVICVNQGYVIIVTSLPVY